MARNIEVKARVEHAEAVLKRLQGMDAQDHGVLKQEDIYFRCANGRLKLRLQEPPPDELIFYERPDEPGPKPSAYIKQYLGEAEPVLELLGRALGRLAAVRKQRRLFTMGRTRIHLDDVADLGTFLELEVMMQPQEPEEEGRREAVRLLKALRVDSRALVAESYLDLVLAQRG